MAYNVNKLARKLQSILVIQNSEQIMQTDTIIIGAGLTGLATAYSLSRKKSDFLVLERGDRPGGVIHTRHKDGFTFEEGPNTGVISNQVVVDLFAELGCPVETASDNARKRFILKRGQWQPMPMGPVSAITTPLFSWRDKFRILGEPFREVGSDPDETLAQFVRRRMGGSFLDYAVDPFIKGVYAGDPERLVLRHALPKLYNLEKKYGSLIGGSIKKSRADKKDGVKPVSRKTFSARGGLSSLVSSLYEKAGSQRFLLGCRSISINPNGNGFTVAVWKDCERFEISARRVITTVPAYELDNLLPFADRGHLAAITSLEYAPVVEVSLGFNRWRGFDADGFGGLVPSREKRDILGVLFMSSLFGNRAPGGGFLCNVFAGGMSAKHLVDLPDNELINIVGNEFSRVMNCIEFAPDLVNISRHKKAIPQYYFDSQQRFDAVAKIQAQYPGLVLAGNLRDGIGMADRIKQAFSISNSI